MTDERNALTDLFTACWKDDALKARFKADPKAVMTERGITVPDDMNVNVVENNDNTTYITLPMAPDRHAELSDEELGKAAGGLSVYAGGMYTGTCGHQLPSVQFLGITLPGGCR